MVTKSATIGIDIGSNSSLCAYVGRGIVDIVQNEVSNRSTPSMVGFTDVERLLGDTALSKIRSNLKSTCRNFKHLIGRQVEQQPVKDEEYWSPADLENCGNDIGYKVTYKGEPRTFSATQVMAMYLTKLREITENWCQAKVSDVVIGVPSDFTDIHRQAIIDAAQISGMSVLRVMNEHTATALSYGIYRSNEFDAEKPCTVAFCSIGHSVFSVAVVQFIKGKLKVLCEKSAKVGGRDMDACLMNEFAARFKKKTGCDPLTSKKAMYKLEDAVGKTKKTLSANAEAGVSVECLMEDEDFGSNMVRADLEQMCQPMMVKMQDVLDGVRASMGVSAEEIDFVELVGGAHRVPFIKEMCKDTFGGKDLSFTMNAEESVCRGCALQAAILSPLYKVRDFVVEEGISHGIQVGWTAASTDSAAEGTEEEGEMALTGNEGQYKTSAVFPEGSLMNMVKILTFKRKEAFDITAEYIDEEKLPGGVKKGLGIYRIELPQQAEPKQVKVTLKLTIHGIFRVESAQLEEEEEYTETIKEKRELPAEEPADASREQPADSPKEEPAEGAAAEGDAKGEVKVERKEPEKKYEWVEAQKTKKRTKKTDLMINANGKLGLTAEEIQKLMDEETVMQAEMREIIEMDEKRNDLESYIFNMRSKVEQGNEYGEFISSGDRDKFFGELSKSEDWLYDAHDATKTQFIEKLNELKVIGDVVTWRFKEAGMRSDWISAVVGTVANYRAAAENPGQKYEHIAPENLVEISSACDELEKWLADARNAQDSLPRHERPVLICADMEKKNVDLAKKADEILKEPKPTPPKVEKSEEKPKAEAKDEAKEDAPQDEANKVDGDQ